jgi:plasmid maintenance system antidote protein VapI
MTKGGADRELQRVEELLQKLLVLQMFSMGATQAKMAKVVGRQKQWVNEILKGIPRKVTDGDTARTKS